ncbi:hypothetical protein [Variovorax rhizosphaerae]|uniref:Uncharacterized protein n=1 Tax=Variovorax rhizosphaerae TaxID=1836200 RepID=A0ABU8WY74_9BURK
MARSRSEPPSVTAEVLVAKGARAMVEATHLDDEVQAVGPGWWAGSRKLMGKSAPSL